MKHRLAPHFLVPHPFITTQYGPVCVRCPKPAISRWHLVRSVPTHRPHRVIREQRAAAREGGPA